MPYEESVGTLKELQDEGKIRHVGVSNVSVEQLEQARGIVDVVSVQNRFNLGDRHAADVLAACQEAGIAFIPWFPLNAGALAEPGGPAAEIADAHDATPAQVALAWLLATEARSRSPAPARSSTSKRTWQPRPSSSPTQEVDELTAAET